MPLVLQLRPAEGTTWSGEVVMKVNLEGFVKDLADAREKEVRQNERIHRHADLSREHPYLPRFPLPNVRISPYALPKGFQWITCDMTDEKICDEVCSLFTIRDIHPDDLFNNSKEYLRWCLCPPCYFPDWHVGVRKAPHGKLVAFVSAVPSRIRVGDAVFPMAVLRHLYVHILEEETIPRAILFSEIIRRINLKGIWQQVYQWEPLLPEPIAVSGLWKRNLDDLSKLEDLGCRMPRRRMSIKQISRSCRLRDFTGTSGLRKMRPSDVIAITILLRKYLSQFIIAPVFLEEDVCHWLLPRENVLDSFVIETSDEITDFFSYTRQQSQYGQDPTTLTVARLFYYATSTSTTPLARLIKDALLAAIYHDCHLFVVDGFLNNETFLNELKFESSHGTVQYNFNNYPMEVLRNSDVGLSIQ